MQELIWKKKKKKGEGPNQNLYARCLETGIEMFTRLSKNDFADERVLEHFVKHNNEVTRFAYENQLPLDSQNYERFVETGLRLAQTIAKPTSQLCERFDQEYFEARKNLSSEMAQSLYFMGLQERQETIKRILPNVGLQIEERVVSSVQEPPENLLSEMNAYGHRINAWRGLSDYSWMPQKGRETLAELFYHGALKPDEETILFGDVKDQERVRDLITAYPESTRPSIAQAMLRELEQGEIYEPSFWNELERISQDYTENQLREFADNLDRTEDVAYWPVEIAEMAIGQEPEVAEELFNLGRNKSTTYRELENIVR